MKKSVWIVDFGSQYTQLITRRTREIGHSSEIITFSELKRRWDRNEKPKALVLSGGPRSISEDENDYSFIFTDESLPILGICYGMQIIAQTCGGLVERGEAGEYGLAPVVLESEFKPKNVPDEFIAWMSHFDHVTKLPEGMEVIIRSKNGPLAGIKHQSKPLMGLQFHPEVEHTANGKELLEYFYSDLAKMTADWDNSQMLEEALSVIKEEPNPEILCAFSGGVDSLVAATLAQMAFPGKVHCFFVDHGLLRPQDIHHIETLKTETDLHIEVVNVAEQFFEKLAGVNDPEKKRKIIGHEFITVFEQKVKEFEENKGIHFTHLLQGTLYPDVIESVSPHGEEGASVTIKSHHNVGGLPERMKLKLMEPLRYLFKDEVRILGESVGLRHEWVHRHPFPGPGIGVRVLGELTKTRVQQVQQSDQILFEELKGQNLYESTWQALTVLLPVKTVGVKGDTRAYEEVICLRLVNSSDGMTAEWTDLPRSFLSSVSRRITNEVAGITRVVYDITDKPPGTIEWE